MKASEATANVRDYYSRIEVSLVEIYGEIARLSTLGKAEFKDFWIFVAATVFPFSNEPIPEAISTEIIDELVGNGFGYSESDNGKIWWKS